MVRDVHHGTDQQKGKAPLDLGPPGLPRQVVLAAETPPEKGDGEDHRRHQKLEDETVENHSSSRSMAERRTFSSMIGLEI